MMMMELDLYRLIFTLMSVRVGFRGSDVCVCVAFLPCGSSLSCWCLSSLLVNHAGVQDQILL